jgi:fructose-1,6-bisphosphatase/inositol monophosphatase family enzyme
VGRRAHRHSRSRRQTRVILTDLRPALDCALRAAKTACQILLRECARPEGPRGDIGKCPADDEAELVIRDVLASEFPRWGFLGEETEFRPPPAGETDVWVVDPNDGTTSMQRGYRGHAVSIALLREGVPVLGVVLAVDAPDDRGDLFAWAEGCGPLERNGLAIPAASWPAALEPEHVVGVSQGANRNPLGYAECVAPARFIGTPSIAYRLALVAAGEHAATLSLNYLQPWDYAAGHALIRAAGGVVLDEYGRDIVYRFDGEVHATRVFAGPPPIIHDLIGRHWDGVSRSGFGDAPPQELYPMRAQPGRLVHDPSLLSRAHGCLLGLIAGDWREGRPGPYAEEALLFARTLVSGEPPPPWHQSSQAIAASVHGTVLGIWGTFRAEAEVVAAASGHADALLAKAIATAIRDGSLAIGTHHFAWAEQDPIALALRGAVQGRDVLPQSLRNLILSSRQMGPGGRSPIYWPTDALVLAERLLTSTPTRRSVSYALTA